jgi:hypothetical protein
VTRARTPEQPSVRRSRRSFLRAVGASALAYPFLRSLEISAVEAATGVSPQRLICFYFPHGVSSPLFRRQATDTEDSFDLTFVEPRSGAPCVLRSFDDAATYGTSYKDKIVVIDGLDFVSGAVGHDGTRCVFTGSGTTGTGSSIEQYLALEAGLGAHTPFSSLVLGVGSNKTGDYLDNVSYYKGVAVSKLIDPAETFDTVFGGVIANGDPEKAAQAAVRRARGQSVVDFLRADIEHLSARLAPRELAKLDQHLTSVFEVEKQLAAFERVTCTAPGAPPAFASVRSGAGGEVDFEQITNLQLDLLAHAMTCDLTRFASFWMADLSRGAVIGTDIVDHPVFNPGNPDVHQTVAHGYRAPYDSADGVAEPDPGVPSSWELNGIQQHYAYRKAVRLIDQLQRAALLDASLVMVGNDMGDSGLHLSDNVPYVLAGSAGGKLRTGRYLSLKADCPPGRRDCEGERTVVPVNRLLVSVAQMFGQELDSFGETIDPEHARGTLEGLV